MFYTGFVETASIMNIGKKANLGVNFAIPTSQIESFYLMSIQEVSITEDSFIQYLV